MTLGQGHDTPSGHGQQLCEILSRSNLTVRRYGLGTDFGYMAFWPCDLDLGSRSWHTLGSWTTIVWNIQIQLGSEELWPGHRFMVCEHCDLDLGDETLGQLVTHPWVMDNNCVKYPDPTWQWGFVTQIFGKWPWSWRYVHCGLVTWRMTSRNVTCRGASEYCWQCFCDLKQLGNKTVISRLLFWWTVKSLSMVVEKSRKLLPSASGNRFSDLLHYLGTIIWLFLA